MLLGVHGKLGSGKDTVFERLRDGDSVPLAFAVERRSFADKLKDSAAALLGIDREQMERLKRDELGERHRLRLVEYEEDGSPVVTDTHDMTMRTFLQRYGTESHRDIFGQNFWVDQAMQDIYDPNTIYVFTDVRFANEAEAIVQLGGHVWEVVGPDSDTGDHASEVRLPEGLIHHTIDNTVRDDDFGHLDSQIDTAILKTLRSTP